MIISSVVPPAPGTQALKQDQPAEETQAEETSSSEETQTEETSASGETGESPSPETEETSSADPSSASEQAAKAESSEQTSAAPAAQSTSSSDALALSALSQDASPAQETGSDPAPDLAQAAEISGTSESARLSEADLREFAIDALENPDVGEENYLERLFGPLDLTSLASESDNEPRTVLTEAVETYKAIEAYGEDKASALDTI